MSLKMSKAPVWAAVVPFFLTALMLVSCGGNRDSGHPLSEQSPGSLAGGIYVSSDGRFAVEADETLWKTAAQGEEPGLVSVGDERVTITFSRTEGLGEKVVGQFGETFVDSYLEGIREAYPDAEAVDSGKINDHMARLDMTMTDPGGHYRMYQILCLATDGENGYIITAAMPEELAGAMREEIGKVLQSLQFL